jgi:tRNA pseudouridine32 synthase/23S rRNA pseudouridine746 synthase
MLHALSTSVPSPRQFTYPFCYDVDPLAEAASEELQHYIATTGLMSAEKGCGKMFGVLVVELPSLSAVISSRTGNRQ